MPRVALAIVGLLALGMAGCAVAGSVGTASVRAEGDAVTVRGSEWGGGVACGTGRLNEPACSIGSVSERFP
jgi:hypothetical protein